MSKDECMDLCGDMKGGIHHGKGMMKEGKAGCCMEEEGEAKKKCCKMRGE
jgi:hypothetical protein